MFEPSLMPFLRKVNMPETSVRTPLKRSVCAQAILRLLWGQYCAEEGRPLVRVEDADLEAIKPFREAAEFITNFALSPDRTEAALMAMADVMCADGLDECDIFTYPKSTQAHYYHLAVSALHALQENVKEVPPDARYRDELCRLVDTILPAPKDGGR